MDTERARQMMEAYAASHDPQYLAEDAVFTDMLSGQVHEGRAAVAGMLDFVYHRAFDAHAETRALIVDSDRAVLEGHFVGRHIGEFAGIPPTGREVRVPLCVTYELAEDGIKRGRIYLAVPVMMEQLGMSAREETTV